MKKVDLVQSNYNYYPRTMIALCVASYSDINDIEAEVQQLGLEIAWGPVESTGAFGIPYSLMYLACNPNTQEYTVVIRGTHYDSLWSWLTEDFDVGNTQAFNQLAPSAPADANISQATYNGMMDLITLVDPTTGKNIYERLKEIQPQYLYVTGHSLGGTLTDPMFAYLNDALYGGGWVHNMACWSFAALTSGDAGFAAYYNSICNPEFPSRIHNPMDIAPFLFYSQTDLQNIYDSYGLPWDSLDIIARGVLDTLFAISYGISYMQPQGDQVLATIFNENENGWADQALYQHHSTTYQALVNEQYPL